MALGLTFAQETAIAVAVGLTYMLITKLPLIYRRKARIAAALARLPSLPGHKLFGNLVQQHEHIHDHYYWKLELFETLGSTYAVRVDLLMDGSVCTSSAANVQHILASNHTNYVKPAMMQRALSELMGRGIFNVNPSASSSWKAQRKIIASLFSTNAIKTLMDAVFLEHTSALVSEIEAQGDGALLDVEAIALSLTTKFTYAMAFGLVFETANATEFRDLFREASNLSVARFTQPWYRWLGWFMPSEYRLARVMRRINALCRDTIRTKRLSATRGNDLLSELLRRQEAGDNLISDTFIRDMMMTMMLAGRETVGSGLAWILYAVSKHSDVEARLLSELQASEITYASVGCMSYLDAIVRETFRLFPPVPYELKSAVADDVLPDGTFVPAGTNVEFSPFVMGRDHTRWPQATTFSPERWLTGATRPSAFEYPVFHAGPRRCVGQSVALLQLKVVVASLYQRFTFELIAPLNDPAFELGIGLFSQDGIQVRAYLRP
ncbi:hypothetical protein SPRG_05985 [Saprolegnia parasitica CBS 223.65]|uniref:Cytochrome P450 n=1 Tax=Saprolegnia parasitica (strain CBS 223.65) TaxID=695850 RepID=A0A067CRL1_SAPPC|nr:hypothetical protein SPRG_05985 [Saprolegnia parasitica CBS 223.65]KDO29447.1 hypothetical protein SPRG_05985 [Saprolegnia parasitica CBS 223.65]|eukprot:XP_012199946.1 hypothetical protein SPRG_05985 [Saprolegnia parasitica CBS 223.65]